MRDIRCKSRKSSVYLGPLVHTLFNVAKALCFFSFSFFFFFTFFFLTFFLFSPLIFHFILSLYNGTLRQTKQMWIFFHTNFIMAKNPTLTLSPFVLKHITSGTMISSSESMLKICPTLIKLSPSSNC